MKSIKAEALSDFLKTNDIDTPVAIERDGVYHAVMIPFELYQATHKAMRQAVRAEDLTDDQMRIIRESEAAPECAKYDDEMDR